MQRIILMERMEGSNHLHKTMLSSFQFRMFFSFLPSFLPSISRCRMGLGSKGPLEITSTSSSDSDSGRIAVVIVVIVVSSRSTMNLR